MAYTKIVKCKKCRRCVTRTRWHLFEHMILYHGGELIREPDRARALANYATENHAAFGRELYYSVAKRILEKLYGKP